MSNPSYKGPVAVTGHRLDGPGLVFSAEAPQTEYRLVSPWPEWIFRTRSSGVPSPGGYEWDVNGHRFHYKIVFNTTVERV